MTDNIIDITARLRNALVLAFAELEGTEAGDELQQAGAAALELLETLSGFKRV